MSWTPLLTATAGLKATQAAIALVSQNVANAGTAGYVRRSLSTVSNGQGNSGVALGTVTRSFDAAALRQLRLETGGAAYTATRADILGQLDKLYGTPGSAAALDGVLNTFTQSLQDLAANPTSAPARTSVTQNAAALAGRIGDIADGVQALRTGIEARLGTETAEASTLLRSVAALNLKIQATGDDGARADLLDQRDQAVNQLSGYLDIQVTDQRDGTVTINTGSGVTLVDRGNAAVLSFDGRVNLGPQALYDTDPDARGVGTVTATTPGGARIDLGEPGVLRSGTLAAELELRDRVLPQAQRQLDDLAAGLAGALTDRSVTGTASGQGFSVDIAGIQAGNTLTVPVRVANGTTRNVVLVASDSATRAVDPRDTHDATAFAQTFDISGGPDTYAAKIREALEALADRPGAPTLTADGGGADVTITGGAEAKVTGIAGRITVPSSAGDLDADPQIPLFVDGSGNRLVTGSLDGTAQRTGLAQRLAVNPAVPGRTASLVASGSDTAASGARAQFVFDALTSAPQTFSSQSGIGGVSAPHATTVVGFAQDIIAAQGGAAANAQSLDEGQSVALATAQSRFSAGAGVSVDEEMANLIALQTAYGANARVLTAARDMLDTLLRI